MKKEYRKINLQLFADGGNGDGGATGGGDNGNQQGQETTKTFTQDDVNKLLQSETDKRVTDALKTAQTKWEKEFSEKLAKEKAETERLAKLTADEKQQEEIKKKNEELANKESELRKRELKLDTINALSEKKLPVGFSDFLMGADADSTHANIKKFAESFQNAIENAVNDRLKGKPPASGNKTGDLSFEQILVEARKNGNLAEQIKIIDEAAKEGKILL